MEQPEGILVSGRTEGHTCLQVLESMGMQKKARCFACNDTSHSLDQCGIKYKLVTVAHQFGYATKFPFSMIQPSEEMLEKEKLCHHCVLITSNVTNLDLGILKGELQKLWNLSGCWVLKRDCSKSFLASFSSQDDVVSCLKKPNMEALLDDKEVKLTVTKCTEDDDESSGLIQQWFLVSGVPRKYRAWMELYQVASAFGVLIDVDEGSLEGGDKEPIRLKIALRNHDSAPFSYHYVVGWSSRMVILTVEAKIDSENSSHNTTIVTSTGNHVLSSGDFSNKEHEISNKEHEKELNAPKSILLEGPTCTDEESRLGGKIKENKISTPATTVHNSKNTTGNHVLSSGDFSNKEHEKELNAPKSILLEGPACTDEESRLDGKAKENNISTPAATVNNSKNTTGNHVLSFGDFSKKEHEKELNAPKSIPLEGPACTDEESRLEGKPKENKISTPAATVNNSKNTTIRGLPTSSYKYVYKRRGKKQDVTEAVNKSPSDELDKGMGPKSSNVTTIGASEMACKRELKTKEIDLTGVNKKSEETGACREKEDNSVTLATSTINSKERKISEDTSETEIAQLVTAPTKVIVPEDEQLKPIVNQFYVKVEKEEIKFRKLHAVLKATNFKKVIVFVNTNDKVKSLTEDVSKHYTVSTCHDDMDQHARDTAIKKFQFGSSCNILIAADLRGARNAMKVPIVINYDLPTQSKQYIRRVHQQNDQPGKKSAVINLVTRDDERVLSDIKRLCNGQIKELELDI